MHNAYVLKRAYFYMLFHSMSPFDKILHGKIEQDSKKVLGAAGDFG